MRSPVDPRKVKWSVGSQVRYMCNEVRYLAVVSLEVSANICASLAHVKSLSVLVHVFLAA